MKKTAAKEEVLAVLKQVDSHIDWEKETALVSNKIIDSLMVVSIISQLSEKYDIEFDFECITPACMDSLDAITDAVNQQL